MRLTMLFAFALLRVVHSGAGYAQKAGAGAKTFALTSSEFAAGAAIPSQYSCKGSDISPPLSWSGTPAGTVSFALIVDDPDAPSGTWVHWVTWNIPPTARSLPEAEPKGEQLADGTRQGRNSNRQTGYSGPCPPEGQTHRYFFRLYALDGKLELAPGASRADLDAAMQGHVKGQAEYMGTFRR